MNITTKTQKIAAVLGVLSAPISFAMLIFGLTYTQSHSLIGSVLGWSFWISVVIHPVVVFMYLENERLRWLWFFVLLLVIIGSINDSMMIRADQEQYLVQQNEKCNEIAKACKPEYENAYKWWICPEEGPHKSTVFLDCSEWGRADKSPLKGD